MSYRAKVDLIAAHEKIERLRAALEKIVGTAGETIPVPAGLNVNAYAEGLRRNQDIASAVLAETVPAMPESGAETEK